MGQNRAGRDEKERARMVKDEAKRERTAKSGTVRDGTGQKETDGIRDRTVMEAMKREARLVEERREMPG